MDISRRMNNIQQGRSLLSTMWHEQDSLERLMQRLCWVILTESRQKFRATVQLDMIIEL